MTQTLCPTDSQHSYDIFSEGDQVPWVQDFATITKREITDSLEDVDIPEWMIPEDYTPVESVDEADYVLLTLSYNGEEKGPMTATYLAQEISESFDQHGLPTVTANIQNKIGTTGKTRVQTPATGMNTLEKEETRELATFLRENADFEPLWALLGDVKSEDEITEIADSLERAARIRELAEKIS